MRRRDEIDSTREVAPLQPAEDAVILDSDDKDIATVFEAAMSLMNGARKTDSD
jgi:cytidylate kinase